MLNLPKDGIVIQCLLERDTVSAVIHNMDTQETKVFVVNVRIDFKNKLEPLGLNHRCIKHKLANNEKPELYDYTQTVFAAEKVPWIEKTIFIVE